MESKPADGMERNRRFAIVAERESGEEGGGPRGCRTHLAAPTAPVQAATAGTGQGTGADGLASKPAAGAATAAGCPAASRVTNKSFSYYGFR